MIVGMDLSHLLYFKTVVEHGSVSKAAKALFISQPALSASIAKVESDVGVSLFDREGRQIVLNRSGEVYYHSVVKALNALQQGKHDAVAIAEGTENVISLAAFTYVSFSTITKPFLKEHSDSQFRLCQLDSTNPMDQILSGDIDFGITCQPLESPLVSCYHMLVQKIFVTVPKDHRLSGKSYVRLEDLRDEPFILMNRNCAYRALTDRIFEEAGFQPKISCELASASLMAGMISSGSGISLLPDTFSEHQSLSKISVSHPKCFHNVYLVWSKERTLSPVAQNFLNFVFENYRDYPKNPDTI